MCKQIFQLTLDIPTKQIWPQVKKYKINISNYSVHLLLFLGCEDQHSLTRCMERVANGNCNTFRGYRKCSLTCGHCWNSEIWNAKREIQWNVWPRNLWNKFCNNTFLLIHSWVYHPARTVDPRIFYPCPLSPIPYTFHTQLKEKFAPRIINPSLIGPGKSGPG